MTAAISLVVVLLSMCGAQTRSTQTEIQTESQGTGAAAAAEVFTQLDVSAELKELRDMVVDLRSTLQYTQEDVKVLEADNVAMKQRLAVSESKVEVLEAANVAVKGRLVASETKVEALERAPQDTKSEMKTEVGNLKKENAVQEAELAALKTRLAATETEVKYLKKGSAAHEQERTALNARLAAGETAIDNLKKENAAQEAELTAVKTRLAATETEVENLERKIKAAPKVAFSAGLGDGYIESGRNDLNLVFERAITNVGQAYSNVTGLFTAPVRGVYYFRFTVADRLHSRFMHIRMYKNGERLMNLNEHDTDGQTTYLSSGLTLQLEKGDTVNLVLPAGNKLYDSSNNHNTFSGFLLFLL